MSAAVITRDELVGIASRLLNDVEAPYELRVEVMDVARTVDRVTKAWWVPEENCGCLIGTTRHRRGEDELPGDDHGDPVMGKEADLGSLFVTELHLAARPHDGGRWVGYDEPVAVIDT